MNKSDIEKIIVNKTIAEAQRFLKQYDYKMCITRNDGVNNAITKHDKKTCFVIVENNIIKSAVFLTKT